MFLPCFYATCVLFLLLSRVNRDYPNPNPKCRVLFFLDVFRVSVSKTRVSKKTKKNLIRNFRIIRTPTHTRYPTWSSSGRKGPGRSQAARKPGDFPRWGARPGLTLCVCSGPWSFFFSLSITCMNRCRKPNKGQLYGSAAQAS